LLSPAIQRLLESYRGIVLEVTDGEALVQLASLPAEWRDEIDAPPGSIVDKQRGHWRADISSPETTDRPLLELYARYTSVYEGTIVELRPALSPQAASVAIVELADGKRLHVPLWSAQLSTAAVGRRLQKRSGSWEPELVPEGEPVFVP